MPCRPLVLLVKILSPRRGLILALFLEFLSLLHSVMDSVGLMFSRCVYLIEDQLSSTESNPGRNGLTVETLNGVAPVFLN